MIPEENKSVLRKLLKLNCSVLVSRKKHKGVTKMVKCFMLALCQPRGGRVKKKGSVKDIVSQTGVNLSRSDTLLTQRSK